MRQVKSSPCRDEHVLYRFSPVQPRRYRADAYKLVAGAEVFMGPIDVVFDPASGVLDGAVTSGGPQALGRLRLMVRRAHLTGKMTLADGSLYRLIDADKR